MMAIVRKTLASLCWTHKSCVSSPLSLAHFFSTQRSPKTYDLLLHGHKFSAEVASKVASDLGAQNIPIQNADSIVSFLKESGCSITQVERIVKYRPRILLHSVEDIKSKVKIFQDLGLSAEDIAKMLSSNQVILHLRAESNIIPTLALLKGLLGSDYDVARLLRKSAWPLSQNLDNSLVPNVVFLKSFGVPMEHILFLVRTNPRCLLIRPDVMRKSAEKAKEVGFSESSKMFVHALRAIICMSERMWQVKLQSFRELGFSESESLTMFNKYPPVFNISTKKMEKVKQLLLGTGKFNMSNIVNSPLVFGCSIEQRLEPRLRILESNNLIKWPGLSTMCKLSQDKFFERFVRPYQND